MDYLTQLEPNALIELFMHHPPEGMKAQLLMDAIPSFSAPFDLLTTAEPDFRQKIKALPLFSYWHQWLKPNTCFIGTTVSEYALLPAELSPVEFVRCLKQNAVQQYPFVIVKDIPCDSPLQTQASNSYANELMEELQKAGFIKIDGQALAWVPVDYASVDDYLLRLSTSRRKDFRRKLKKFDQVKVEVKQAGDTCFFDAHTLALYYQLYLNVFNQSEIHFDLLSASFFKSLLQDKNQQAVIISYYHQEQLVAYNICYVINDTLLDKYIGFNYPLARELNLYYLSWFYNLQYALDHGLKKYIAGWTDPVVKATLGAQFTMTKHFVHIRNPLLRGLLKQLSSHFESDNASLEGIQRGK